MHKSKFVSWAGFAVVLVGWGLFSSLPLNWAGWQPASCLPDACFCEAPRPGAQAQPANAWSSLAFVLPGLLVLSATPVGSAFTDHAGYRRTLGVALLVIGLGSAFYHASLTFAGQFLDVMGMYLLISFAALYALSRLGALTPAHLPLTYLAANLLLGGLLLWLPAIRREVFAGLVGLTLILEGWRLAHSAQTKRSVYLAGALLSLAAAFVIWTLDNTRVLCAPHSWLQGHAIWHLLGALAAWLLYQYYLEPARKIG